MEYLLYGANGYTGQLILKESLKAGLRPIVAGRNATKVEALAQSHNLPFRVFSLENPQEVVDNLSGISLCLNAAGPFSKTAFPMVQGCIEAGVHYLDITGEVAVFEQIKKMGTLATEKGIMLMPGTGFDVVPSDCLANFLHEKLPNADSLELAFTSVGGSISHGTASTLVEVLGEPGWVRRKGKMTPVRLAHKSKRVDFGDFSRTMATIPWGDVSTAYTSTGIHNIEVYTSMPRKAVRLMKLQGLFNPLLRTKGVRRMIQKRIDKKIYGPTPEQNKSGRSNLHGVIRKGNQSQSAILVCAEGYLLTALASVSIARKVLEGNLKEGYQTPAMAYGWKLILEFPGSEFRDL